MNLSPFIALFLFSLMAGTSLGHNLPPSQSLVYPFLFILLSVCGSYCYVTFVKKLRIISQTLLCVSVLLFSYGKIGGLFPKAPQNHIKQYISDEKVTIEGVVSAPIATIAGKQKIILTVSKMSRGKKTNAVSGSVQVTVYDRTPLAVKIKDRVKINSIRLKQPRNFKNPGGFDYENYLQVKGIDLVGNISSTSFVKIVEESSPYHYRVVIQRVKEKMLSFLKNNAPEDLASILSGMVLGEKGGMKDEIKRRFSSVGIAHLFAVSGLHIGFLAGTFFIVFNYLLFHLFFTISPAIVKSGRQVKIAAFLTVIPVILYTLLTGASISSQRACLMIIIYLTSIIAEREGGALQSLFLAAIVILFVTPHSLFSIGFQLSFLTVFIIILTCNKCLSHKQNAEWGEENTTNRIKKIKHFFIITAFATLATSPLILFSFNTLSPYAFFTNLLVIPLVTFLIPFTLLCCIVSLFSLPVASIALKIVLSLLSFLVKIVDVSSLLPFSLLHLPPPSIVLLFLYYLVMIALLLHQSSSIKKILTIMVLFLVLLPVQRIVSARKTSNILEVTFIDVGQGESILIQFPNKETVLIDGGSSHRYFDKGERIVVPFLLHEGITHLTYIAATHPDNDHIGGLPTVMKTMKVGTLIDNGHPHNNKTMLSLFQLAEKNNVERIIPDTWRTLTISKDISLELLHPNKIIDYKKNPPFDLTDNNLSLVIKLTYKKVSFLFTGDIEKEAEEYLLSNPALLASTILKVSHHGSASSTTREFLSAVSPEAAIISAGYKNRFGHPKKTILARLNSVGAAIYRTDTSGAITITTDGEKYWITTYEKNAE